MANILGGALVSVGFGALDVSMHNSILLTSMSSTGVPANVQFSIPAGLHPDVFLGDSRSSIQNFTHPIVCPPIPPTPACALGVPYWRT